MCIRDRFNCQSRSGIVRESEEIYATLSNGNVTLSSICLFLLCPVYSSVRVCIRLAFFFLSASINDKPNMLNIYRYFVSVRTCIYVDTGIVFIIFVPVGVNTSYHITSRVSALSSSPFHSSLALFNV